QEPTVALLHRHMDLLLDGAAVAARLELVLGWSREIPFKNGLRFMTIFNSDKREESRITFQKFSVRVSTIHAYMQPLEQVVQAHLQFGSSTFCFAVLQAPSHGGSESRIVFWRFDDVVIESGFHRLDCDLLRTGRREHNDRPVRVQLLYRPQYGQ